jgi:hypothetical protein
MKKNKKNPLDHNPELLKKREALRGFEEIIDLIPGSRFQSKQKNDPKLNEDFELLNLLENEYQRLLKLEQFFFQKLSNMDKYNQIDKLIQNQMNNRDLLKEQILKFHQEIDSHLQINIAELMNQTYSK